MGDMYFKTANDDTTIRFYPYVVKTEPGMYEVRGSVVNIAGTQTTDLAWNACNFGAFWYDLNDNLMTEVLTISANALSALGI